MRAKITLALPMAIGKCTKSLCLLLITSFLFYGLSTTAQNNRQLEFEGPEAKSIIEDASYVKMRQDGQFPAFVRMEANAVITPENFTSWLKSTLNFNEGIDFELVRTESDDLGFTHYRYVQTYRGVPIDPTGYVAHVKNGVVKTFNGKAIKIPDLSAQPGVSEAAALQNGLTYVGAERYMWEDDTWESELKERKKDNNATYFPKGDLVYRIYDDQPVLSYRFDIFSASPHKEQRVYVNASNGSILTTLPLESNCSGASVNTVFDGNQNISTDKFTANDWRLRDDCDAAVIRVRDWNSATTTHSAIDIENTTNTWTTMDERFGGSVLWQTKQCYSYFLNVHTRSSYDGADGGVNAFINAVFGCGGTCTSVNNASMSFTGGTMKVGLSSAGVLTNSYATLDIIAHEYAHAVTGSTSMLDYNAEPGALNESFSDIFAEVIERWVMGSTDWLIGAQRDNGAIRSMSNPNAGGDPDTYQGTNWVATGPPPCNSTNDECGVHTNSGVQNFWFYLLSVGGTGTNDNGDDYEVDGIGINKARMIAYRNLTSYLGAFSMYSDARDGSIQAAIDLYGDCSDEVRAVVDAWHAVGIGDPFLRVDASVTSDYNGRDVSCFGDCDGQITSSVEGWNVTNGVSVFDNLCAGNYTVTVTDADGCNTSVDLSIVDPPLLTASATATSNYNGYNISCNGENDGSALATPSGGTAPYSYQWNSGQVTAAIGGLTAGNYSVTITDANGCTAMDNVTLTEPPVLNTTVAATSNYNGFNVSCFGGSDGVAEAYPSGGVPPYSYQWDDASSQVTKVASGLMALTYNVIVTDDNGCTANAQVTLTEPPPLSIEAHGTKTVYYGYPDSACADLTTSNAMGGVPPYTLEWSTGETTDAINVCPMVTTIYYVTITDLNGCTFKDSVKVCVIDVRCGKNLKGILICHSPQGNPANSLSLCVGFNSVANHLAIHRDLLADCDADRSCSLDDAARLSIHRAIQEHEYFTEVVPNPFSDQVMLYFVPEADYKISVKIFDISGRVIDNLYDGAVEKDVIYNFEYDSGNLPEGMYMFSITSSTGIHAMEKVILSR